jgi:hypothetical protein
MTKIKLDLCDMLTDVLGNYVLVPTTIDVSDMFEFNDASDYEIDVDSLLREHRMIGHLWGTGDVQSLRPELSDEQAWQVLQHLDEQFDSSLGISWDDLEHVSNELFGASASQRVSRCEAAIASYGDEVPTTNLIDLLSDVMHWCQASGHKFDAMVEMARAHFSAETPKEGRLP